MTAKMPIGHRSGTRLTIVLAVASFAAAWAANGAQGPGGSVGTTVHNLSVSGPGEIRSVSETEICKFCHIPHTASQEGALWGHALPAGVQYGVPEVRTRQGERMPAPQPDGASRLCLSCHDGTVALGDVLGEPRPIPMLGAIRLQPGQAGYIGVDLTGSHPVSIVVPDGDEIGTEVRDMGLRPLASIRMDTDVRLDAQGKMQCTTCHDPHSDRYYDPGRVPRFWVKPNVREVCLTCHELR